MVLFLLRLLAGFDGLYGQDPYEYYRYTKELVDYFKNGNHPGDYFWPIGYPLTGAILNILIPSTSLSLQLVSIISCSIVLIYTNKIIHHIFPNQNKDGKAYLFLFFCLSPFVFRFAITIMSDMLTLATLLSGSYYCLKYIQQGKLWSIILGMLLLGCSIMTRYAVAVLIAPIIAYLIITMIKQKKHLWHFPILLIFAFLPMIPHLMIRNDNATQFLFHQWLINWSPMNWFSRSFKTTEGYNVYKLPNILYNFLGIFHPRFFVFGMIIIALGFKKFKWSSDIKILLISVLLYLVFLSGIPFQNNRFLLLTLPFILVIFFQPYNFLRSKFNNRTNNAITLVFVFIQLGFCISSFLPVYQRAILEKKIFDYVIASGEPTVYTMDMDISLKGRGYSAEIHNIWKEFYAYPDTTAIIIFNTIDYPKQWKGMNPMKNWDHFNKNYTIQETFKFTNGWKAYEFK
jgi:4-amino-4-deoxy-L-arabinose transferase-like glycosyltransferase